MRFVNDDHSTFFKLVGALSRFGFLHLLSVDRRNRLAIFTQGPRVWSETVGVYRLIFLSNYYLELDFLYARGNKFS